MYMDYGAAFYLFICQRSVCCMLFYSGLSQIKKNLNKATIYRVMDIKCGNISKPLKNMNYYCIHYRNNITV